MGCRNGHSSQEIKYSFTVVIKEMKIEVHFFYMMDHFDALKNEIMKIIGKRMHL